MQTEDVHLIYSERLRQRRQSLKEFLIRARAAGYLRGGAGLLIPVTVWLVFVPHVVSGWVVLIPAAAFFGLHRYYEDTHGKLNRAKRAIEFYEKGIARVENRWMGAGITHTAFADTDHLYANDLDIFGKGSLFELLCTARTRFGQNMLAAWFCTPASRSEILRRQEAIEELRSNLDLREELSVFGPDRAAIDFDLATEWAFQPSLLNSAMARVIAPILAALTMAAVGYAYWFRGEPMWMILAAAVQAGFALAYRKRVKDVILAIPAPAGELQLLEVPLTRLEREAFSSPRLRELRAALQTAGRSASQRLRTLIGLNEMLEYRRNSSIGPFLCTLLWATQVAFAIEAWRSQHRKDLQHWMRIVGEFEVLSALAGFAFEHPECPFPEILEGPARLEGDALRHPLLPETQCVPNSLSLGRGLQLLIVSGSNMSGKSTLLRTVGINVVLAQAGAPVCARHLKCSPLTIGATLRVQDSLQTGRSRFYAEIRRLKAMMTLAEEGSPILFLLDEIMHGTNSHDRVTGAEAVVRGLVEKNAIGLVTTHDLALTRVGDALAPRAANVHFEDHLENSELIFDYRLHNGIIQKSNALELMRAIGLKV